MEENPYKSPASSEGTPPLGAPIRRWWPLYYVLSIVAGAVAVDPLMDCPPHASAGTRIGICLTMSGFHVTVGFALFGLFILLRNWLRRPSA